MSVLASGSVPFSLIRTAVVNRVALAINSSIPVIDGVPQSPSWVRPVASDKYEITATENWFAVIRTYGPNPVDSTTGSYLSGQGAGRLAVNISRRIRIYLYSRSDMDTVGGDETSLGSENNTQTVNTPPTWPGHDILEDLVLNALMDWLPTYTDPNTMVVTPLTLGTLHWIDSADGPVERPPENEIGLIRSHLDFEAIYIGSFNIGDPAPLSLPVPINNPV